tara:strand:- start:194 stop:358 length:165 start_codon:yes stop_codon:yes gene_type:complete
MVPEALPYTQRYAETIKKIQEEIANEVGVKFINVFDEVMKLPEKERCEMQHKDG